MLQAIVEVILHSILYPIFEALLRAPGYLLLRTVRRSCDSNFESDSVAFAGMLIWLLVTGIVLALFWIL